MKQELSQDEISSLLSGGGQPKGAAQPAAFPSFESAALPQDPTSLGLLADVELELTVELGSTRKNIREILAMGTGSVMELDRHAGEAVDILVNGRLVARGEVVVIGENYGVRIVELINPDGGVER